ncbi:unknown [Prevotella sp. CAG:924]|nr:unknown [Prevotella sp. CAG:924]
MSETACAAPYTCEQAQYELKRPVPPVGTLNRNAALLEMLGKMAFLEHLEEQGKPAERGYLLVYELYVIFSHQIYRF